MSGENDSDTLRGIQYGKQAIDTVMNSAFPSLAIDPARTADAAEASAPKGSAEAELALFARGIEQGSAYYATCESCDTRLGPVKGSALKDLVVDLVESGWTSSKRKSTDDITDGERSVLLTCPECSHEHALDALREDIKKRDESIADYAAQVDDLTKQLAAAIDAESAADTALGIVASGYKRALEALKEVETLQCLEAIDEHASVRERAMEDRARVLREQLEAELKPIPETSPQSAETPA